MTQKGSQGKPRGRYTQQRSVYNTSSISKVITISDVTISESDFSLIINSFIHSAMYNSIPMSNSIHSKWPLNACTAKHFQHLRYDTSSEHMVSLFLMFADRS